MRFSLTGYSRPPDKLKGKDTVRCKYKIYENENAPFEKHLKKKKSESGEIIIVIRAGNRMCLIRLVYLAIIFLERATHERRREEKGIVVLSYFYY